MPSERIPFENLNNTRDLGGMPAAGGRAIRHGRLIRSGHLFFASEADCARLAELADVIVDFRTPGERQEKPDPVLFGTEAHRIPIFGKPSVGTTHEVEADTRARLEVPDAETAIASMCATYRAFVESPVPLAGYRRFLDILLEPHGLAVLWHCTAGKDRAGFAAVVVEWLLGVDQALIREDYLATNGFLAGEVESLVEMLRVQMGGENEAADAALRCLFTAREEYLDAAFDHARELYGSFDGFLAQGLRVTPEERVRLRELYLA